MSKIPVIHISYANVNLDAFAELNISGGQYIFCEIIRQYQQITGWCEPLVGNNLRCVTGLKGHIGRRSRFSASNTDKAFKALTERGFLEMSQCGQKFRLTPQFFVLTNPAKKGQAEAEAKEEAEILAVHKPRNVQTKTTFAESPMMDFNTFKAALSDTGIIPRHTNFVAYHEKIKHYYTVENVKAYADRVYKCKTWIETDIKNGKHLSVNDTPKAANGAAVAPKTTPNFDFLDDETLLNDVAEFAMKVTNPQTDVQFKDYEKNVGAFIEKVTEAQRRGLLKGHPKAVALDSLKRHLKIMYDTGIDLKAFMLQRIAFVLSQQKQET